MPVDEARVGLALLFTPGVTVEHWRHAGLLEREVRYYERLSSCVGPVAFVSGGDRRLAESRTIRVLSAPAAIAARPHILKTNQLAGVATVLAAKAGGSRIVARGGYIPSEPWRHRSKLSRSYVVATLREAALCALADLVLVTTDSAATYIRSRYRMEGRRVAVVPNFVEVEPPGVRRAPVAGTIAMVGRLTDEKNLFACVDAVAGLPGTRLRLVGDGPLREALCERARAVGAAVDLVGVVPNNRVPALLAEADVFLIASVFEGHPKALLEAMAVGVPCVVTASPGLREMVADGVTGYLAPDTSPAAIRATLARALGDPSREIVGRSARERVVGAFSLPAVLEAECAAYRAAGLLQ